MLAAVAASALAHAPIAAAQTGTALEDVADGAYYAEPVAALAADGVLAGTLCTEGFCPGKPIDRKTMAVRVVRVLDGADPPPVTQSRFTDVDADSFHAPFVERMHRLGVTSGCGDGRGFCPHDNVTRAQMAVFVSRAFKPTHARSERTGPPRAGATTTTANWRFPTASTPPSTSPTPAVCARSEPTRRFACWGLDGAELTEAINNQGRFTAVSAGTENVCGVRTDDSAVCVFDFSDHVYELEGAYGKKGPFAAIDTPDRAGCGLFVDGTAVCWYSALSSREPEGEFTAISTTFDRLCGIRTDRTLYCNFARYP